MVTQKDIARELGVSVSVVSRTLNPVPDRHAAIAPETRERILETARRLKYRPNRTAQSLKHGRSLVIGVFLPAPRDRLGGELMQGIAEKATAENWPTMFHFGHSLQSFRDFLRRSEQYGHSGVISHPSPALDPGAILEYRRRGGEIVMIDPYYADYSGCGIPTVGVDDELGGRIAAERLLARGCGRIAACGTAGGKRYRGFFAALAAAGRPAETMEEAALEAFLADARPTAERPAGIFCWTDLEALSLCNRLAATGRTPGRDVLVIGYDDLEWVARVPHPLTTVRQPMLQLGRTLMEELSRLLAGGAAGCRRLPPELVVRETA